MQTAIRQRPLGSRTGGVYIAVLGTALIVSVLGLSALTLQRVQNRMLAVAVDIHQAQLNSEAAIELGLLARLLGDQWPEDFAANLEIGTCELVVSASGDPDDPVMLEGIGRTGPAVRRVAVIVDPRRDALSQLADSAANGGIQSDQAESMPLETIFDTYKDVGTQINVNNLPSSTPNLGRNINIETGTAYWTGEPPGMPTAEVSQSTSFARSGTYSLRVQDRTAWYAGPAQRIDHIVKPGVQYAVQGWIYLPSSTTRNFLVSIYTKGSGSAQFNFGPSVAVTRGDIGGWQSVAATVTAPSWSGSLEYAFVKFGGADISNTADFYLDDLDIREATTGRFIYRAVVTPSSNPYGGGTNSLGVYWIDCNNNRVIIERSRILGTLLLLNPGAGSCISNGPIHWSPAQPGYPALLVDGDFAIRATNQALSELDNGMDYNLDGITGNYIYPSRLRGLVVVGGDLTLENSPQIDGEVIVGEEVSGVADIQYSPEALLSPPPGNLGPYRYERRPGSYRKVVQ